MVQFFGFNVTKVAKQSDLVPQGGSEVVGDRGNWWWPLIREPFTGAWQKFDRYDYHSLHSRQTTLAFGAVFACVSLIAADIAKLRIKLIEQLPDGTWIETSSPAFSPVLRKPNAWQTRIAFIQQWVLSKLLHGNAYVLKERDNRNVVQAMYVLDPTRVQVLLTKDGDIYYKLGRDTLSQVMDESLIVPASEIMHDVMTPLAHPLVGVSPLIAAGGTAVQGLAIQQHSSRFFANGSAPGGILTAPGVIGDDQAKRLKARWEENYRGENYGRVAILGNGLAYSPVGTNAVDAQLIEQLKWDETNVCTAFKVPPYMIGVGSVPTHVNVQASSMQYYTQCLQIFLEAIELLLVEGLGLDAVPGHNYGVEFDIDQLLRMDTATLYTTISEGVRGGFLKPDEGRAKIGLGPVSGGDVPYLQQQNFSLDALAKRDARPDPFAPLGSGAPGGDAVPPVPELPGPATGSGPKPAPTQAKDMKVTEGDLDFNDIDELAVAEEFRRALAEIEPPALPRHH